MTTVYITKYALSGDIGTGETESSIDGTRITVKDTYGASYYYDDEWHTTWTQAVERAEQMRAARIASLEKSLDKVRALTFPLTPAKPCGKL